MAADHRPVGATVTEFRAPDVRGPSQIEGHFVRLERLDANRHAADLFVANEGGDQVWDYLGYGPFATLREYRNWQADMAAKSDPFFYAIRNLASNRVLGLASYLRIEPTHGVIEIGHIQMSAALQRTAAASEALIMMIRWAFDAGYRRVEWKCDALNEPSRRAARRLGFRFEGIFRQHMIIKGRNRDTAWFAITGRDWGRLRPAHDQWLDPANFDGQGRQRQSLSYLTSAAQTDAG